MPNFFIAYLAQSLAANGSETTFYFTTIKTLTGETITTSLFSTFGRGVVTIDPLNSTNIENASFTAVDGTNIAVTGGIRGLSALSNSVVTANKKYHPVGTPVIISFGTHNILDVLTYVNSLISGGIGNSSNIVSGLIFSTASNAGARPRALSSLVQQQSSPGLTLLVQPFSISDQGFDVVYAGGNTASYTAPTVNPRIDLLVYNANSAALAYRTGTEAASPTKPTPSQFDIVIASIFHRVGETSIKDVDDSTNGYIKAWYYPSVYNANVPASGVVNFSAARATPNGYLLADGAAVARSTYASLFAAISPSQTATISIASPAVITATAHGLVAGDRIHFTTTGALPTGLLTSTEYFVLSTGLTSNAFEVSLSPEGTVINTSGTQSGVHTVYESAFGMGDGSTTFNVPDMRGKTPLGLGAGTQTIKFETGAVGTNTIALPSFSTYPYQGQVIQLTTTGTLPTGLSTSTNYYVIRNSSTSISLATTQANANAVTVTSITASSGSGVHTIVYTNVVGTVIGQVGGEESHGLAKAELAQHDHTALRFGTGGATNATGVQLPAGNSGAGSGNLGAGSTVSTTVDSIHNNMSPFIYGKWIVKT